MALNGFVRFTIVEGSGASVPNARPSRPWSIMAAQGISPRVVPGPTIALAHTQPLPGSGGLMIVYVDRIGTRDLGSVVMHELGHVLGVGHGEKGLMAAHYHPADQQCVDKATITAVAAKRRLAVDQLNWCETSPHAPLPLGERGMRGKSELTEQISSSALLRRRRRLEDRNAFRTIVERLGALCRQDLHVVHAALMSSFQTSFGRS